MDDRVCGPGWKGLIISFIWLLPLTGLGATESGVDRHVIGIITVAATLVSIALGLAVAIYGFRSARFACIVIVGLASYLRPRKSGS